MEDEQEDVKKMTEFIHKQKSSYKNNFQFEFEDFVSFEHDNSDQEFDEESFYEGGDSVFEVTNINLAKEPRLAFTEEEQNTIDQCPDLEFRKLLILNRSKYMQLMKLSNKIREYLIECEEELEEKRSSLKNFETKQLLHRTCVWKLAAPYFKDKKFFPCPLNQETIRKRARNELNVYDLMPSPKWTPIEFDRLLNAVKCNYNINMQNDIVCKISTLKTKIQNGNFEEDEDPEEEMVKLKEQLEKVKLDEKVPPLHSNEGVDWYKVAETFLKDKHTAIECQSVWHMILHPQINRSEWSEEENSNLEAIAKRHSCQNWDEIAAELNTNRTGFTTCLHYFSKLCDKFKRSKFSPEEDLFLLDVVDMYRVGDFVPWNKVVCHFSNRSRHQLYHRYTYFLSQMHVKRGKFSESEDILLLILVNKFGKNFKKCAEYMPHRSQVQVKSRYNSNLQRQLKKGTFTTEDDQIIYNYAQEHGEKSWSGLTIKLKRCNAQIRQRYKLIKAFLQENPNSTIADIPKRRHRYDECSEGQHNFLNYVAEQYKDVEYVPTLSMIEESLQVTQAKTTRINDKTNTSGSVSPEIKLKNIDAMLTDFFSGSMEGKHCSTITETNLNEATENAEEILTLLGAKLDIPQDLECDVHFDNIDVEILERISKKPNNVPQTLIPPNVSTLIGLRSLIIKHKEYKSKQKHGIMPNTTKYNFSESFSHTAEPCQEEIFLHRDQFSKRFDTLFHWGAILSLEKPNQSDIPEQSIVADNHVAPSPGRTYSKRPKPPDHGIVKKRKIDVSALTDLTKHPQLKLVDKNVVENLIKNNNISVIRLESVPGFMPQVSHCTSQSQTGVVTNCDETNRIQDSFQDAVDDVSDIHDIEKLNAILGKMKSERNVVRTYAREEYQSVTNDVKLLKEVLQFEKVKVKSDPDNF